MKKEDFKKKNTLDLTKELDEKLLSLHDIRFGKAGSSTKNVKEYSNIKRTIARIKTSIRAQK